MSPESYLDRLGADFNRLFGPPKISPPDSLAEVEASEGIAAMEETDDE